MRRRIWLITVLALVLSLAGCGASGGEGSEGENSQGGKAKYKEISQDEALELMKKDDGYVLVDVRTKEEYDSGHIPGAINIPNETIGDQALEDLIDPDQTIILYCRTGRRSKEAAQKLADMGYSNVYEMGGINDWQGEIVTEEETAAETETAGKLYMTVGNKTLNVTLENNEAAQALAQLVWDKGADGLSLELEEYGGFEKVGPLPKSLPTSDEQMTAEAGDILLYQGDKLSLMYGENSWEYTKLGHLEGTSEDQLKELLGEGNSKVVLNVTREETNE